MERKANIRNFKWADLGRFTELFNEINGLTHTEKEFDVEFMGQFLAQPSTRPEENCYVAEEDGQIVGFLTVSIELPISRAVAGGGVASSHRSKGIGRELLRIAVAHAQRFDVAVLDIQAAGDGEVAKELLQSEGFELVKTYWGMRWEGTQPPEYQIPPEFSIRSFKLDQDEATLTELQNYAFGEHWGFCPNTVEEIHARVRLDRCDPDGIVLIFNGDSPAGYNWTLWNSNEAGSIGWIAMTGVNPNYRGRRLGEAVVAAGIEYLHLKGADGVELEVDAENAAARGLYLKLGFKKISETVWFEKRLT